MTNRLRSSLRRNSCSDSGVCVTQPNAVVGGGGLPSHMVLLTGIDAEPREVVVKSVCSMDGEFYMANRLRPGLCNIQLKVASR